MAKPVVLPLSQLERLFEKRCERKYKLEQLALQHQIVELLQNQVKVLEIEMKALAKFVDVDVCAEKVEFDFTTGTVRLAED